MDGFPIVFTMNYGIHWGLYVRKFVHLWLHGAAMEGEPPDTDANRPKFTATLETEYTRSICTAVSSEELNFD